ncbi:MAG: leucine-rich repeat domain-containing protein, partial [Acetatifactor sp.]|nr:leucine-rich repeat domain-containing protein [Acetatifactor sp.]
MSTNNKIAVILGYDGGGYLETDGVAGKLVIPDQVDAYAQFTENLGTGNGLAAVGKSDNFLYYRVDHTKLQDVIVDGAIVKDENGNPVQEEVHDYYTWHPCFYNDYDAWKDTALEDFWYFPNNQIVYKADGVTVDYENGLQPTTNDSFQRIQNASVRYIGNQKIVASGATWIVDSENPITVPEDGVFAGVKGGNIRFLEVGKNLSGIGDYAFYGCSNLQGIKLQNGLNTIGVGAFANAINLKDADIDLYCSLNILGSHAFYNCTGLTSFTVPISVGAIQDSAFENCRNMSDFAFGAEGENVNLTQLGAAVFKGCSSLKGITFPSSFAQSVPISVFEGCSSLQFIAAGDIGFDVTQDQSYSYAQFKEIMPESFCFKGAYGQTLHNTATANEFVFGYYDASIGKYIYELTTGTEAAGDQIVYRVDEDDNLRYFSMGSNVSEITLPPAVGPNHIVVINSTSFRNNCRLKKITIPPSIRAIEADAFRGCHNLQSVIFTDPSGLESIGSGAFRTQESELHLTGCSGISAGTPKLIFVGPISYSSTPFNYAMDPN